MVAVHATVAEAQKGVERCYLCTKMCSPRFIFCVLSAPTPFFTPPRTEELWIEPGTELSTGAREAWRLIWDSAFDDADECDVV